MKKHLIAFAMLVASFGLVFQADRQPDEIVEDADGCVFDIKIAQGKFAKLIWRGDRLIQAVPLTCQKDRRIDRRPRAAVRKQD